MKITHTASRSVAKTTPPAEVSTRFAAAVLLALFVGGCAGLPPPVPRPQPMHHAPGGGYVRGDTTYHGSGGP